MNITWAMTGILLTVMFQAAMVFVWGGRLEQRVTALEGRTAGIEQIAVTLARVDERTQALILITNRNGARLDRDAKEINR